MKEKQTLWMMVLLVLVLIGVAADILLTLRTQPASRARPSLPCAAIPTRYILQYPDCADRLLRAMNVTNVRILPRSNLSGIHPSYNRYNGT